MSLPPFFSKSNHVMAITGGLTGIGRAIAISFLSHGARVAINYLPTNETKDQADMSEIQAQAREAISIRDPSIEVQADYLDHRLLFIPGDISLASTGTNFINKTVQKFGRVDTFISNAGICRFEEFLEISPDSWNQHLNTNLSGAFFCVQATARQMTQQIPQGGSIIGVSSISALVGGAMQCHYTPTKAGVLSLMQSCATALGRYGIRCNALLPGTIRTQLNDFDLRNGSEKKKYMEGRIPIGRLGQPDDMAGPALFLAVGELSGYVSGAALLVDGGAFVNFQ